MSFPVHQIDGVDDDGNVTTVTHSLSPDSMTLARGYDAMKEDPDIYKTLDLCGYAAPRQFPEMQLPVPGALAPAQQSSTTATPGQFIPEHLITVMQYMHDEHVHFLKPLGRDPCAYFKEKDKERIILLFLILCLKGIETVLGNFIGISFSRTCISPQEIFIVS